jgi:hypothetical protein
MKPSFLMGPLPDSSLRRAARTTGVAGRTSALILDCLTPGKRPPEAIQWLRDIGQMMA